MLENNKNKLIKQKIFELIKEYHLNEIDDKTSFKTL